ALVGDLQPMAAAADALLRGGKVTDSLTLLGVGTREGPPPGSDLPDDAIVCGCNGVTKATIVEAIQRDGGCTTRACVGKCTRASTSCGSCGPIVDGLLAMAGVAATVAPSADEKPVCACLPLSRPALRARVLELGLRSASAVLRELGDGVGCHKC